jgi:hypothetical protein
MEAHIDDLGACLSERRRHPHLRAIYEEVRGRINHFFHTGTEWANSPMDYLAHRIVHEAYPNLTSQDVRILVTAIERRYQAV